MSAHQTRAHSKYSASGSERWFNCPASVAIEEKSPPSKDSVWSLEGTEAHEVKETISKMQSLKSFKGYRRWLELDTDPMVSNAMKMVRVVREIKSKLLDPIHLVEVRVYNGEIHPEMFGTVDEVLIELFGTLHVFDYKYGQGHVVDPKENKQMIQYALGLLEKYDWNFTDVALHICQPRGGGNGHKVWTAPVEKFLEYKKLWIEKVKEIETKKNKPIPGSHCHWCRGRQINPETGKATCEAKAELAEEKIISMFENNPLTKDVNSGKKESSKKGKQEKSDEEKELERYYKKRAKKENPFFNYENESQATPSRRPAASGSRRNT